MVSTSRFAGHRAASSPVNGYKRKLLTNVRKQSDLSCHGSRGSPVFCIPF
jgi:hypothetical protein